MNKEDVYGFALTTDEMYEDLIEKLDLMQEFTDMLKQYKSFIGVWQEPKLTYQVFIFTDRKERTEAFKKADEMGFKSVVIYANDITKPECLQ